jgi:hypothetical protein
MSSVLWVGIYADWCLGENAAASAAPKPCRAEARPTGAPKPYLQSDSWLFAIDSLINNQKQQVNANSDR